MSNVSVSGFELYYFDMSHINVCFKYKVSHKSKYYAGAILGKRKAVLFLGSAFYVFHF